MIEYKVPWHASDVVEEASVDMVLSQAVLEHVDNLPLTYEQMHRWLQPTGFMSHAIDFKSHGSANEWDGHWRYSDVTWKIISGTRPYTINRQPHSLHRELMTESGFHIVNDITNELPSTNNESSLAPRFRNMQPADTIAASAFVQATMRGTD